MYKAQIFYYRFSFNSRTVICFESRSFKWEPEIEKMHKFMPKTVKKVLKMSGAHYLLSENAKLLKN